MEQIHALAKQMEHLKERKIISEDIYGAKNKVY
jgi:hypothetical protein